MSSRYRILCGVPKEHCQGGKLVTDQKLSTNKCHSDRAGAFRCMAHYLTKVLGYTRIGAREFKPPPGSNGYVRVLSKKSRYGGKLRTGKEHTRYMPEEGRGLIV